MVFNCRVHNQNKFVRHEKDTKRRLLGIKNPKLQKRSPLSLFEAKLGEGSTCTDLILRDHERNLDIDNTCLINSQQLLSKRSNPTANVKIGKKKQKKILKKLRHFGLVQRTILDETSQMETSSDKQNNRPVIMHDFSHIKPVKSLEGTVVGGLAF